jgi:aspartate racemase
MTQHIGIAACTAEGAALCYQTICAEGAQLLGPHAHPEISMHTPSFSEYMKCMRANDWDGVGELLLTSANKVAQMGADFLICPANTMHKAFPLIERRSPRPWLHIVDAVAADALARGFRCIGITGTRSLVNSGIYDEKLAAAGLKSIRPGASEIEEMDRIIFDELNRGVFRPEAVEYLQGVCARLKEQGCDAVVLGCTEFPLIMNDSNSPLPTLDSTRLLARAALKRAVSGSKASG